MEQDLPERAAAITQVSDRGDETAKGSSELGQCSNKWPSIAEAAIQVSDNHERVA